MLGKRASFIYTKQRILSKIIENEKYTKQRILSEIVENYKVELIIENNYSFFFFIQDKYKLFFTPCGSRINNCARQAQP